MYICILFAKQIIIDFKIPNFKFKLYGLNKENRKNLINILYRFVIILMYQKVKFILNRTTKRPFKKKNDD